MSEPREEEGVPLPTTSGGAPSDIAANDPRIVQMLSTEHWSVLSARSLAYNETFTRAGMFLSFLSMSTVALGLLAQGTGFNRDFTVIATIVLSFDLLIGLTTYLRLAGAGYDDLIAVHGMSRIRHAYTEIAPPVQRYFTAPVNDDIDSLMQVYGVGAWGESRLGELAYVLSTTMGMIGLIVCALVGVLAGVVTSLFVPSVGWSFLVGISAAVLFFVALVLLSYKLVYVNQAKLPSMFPAEGAPE